LSAVAQPTPPLRRNKKRVTPQRVLLHAFLITFAVIWIVPVVWAVFTSFRSYADTAVHGYVSWPHHLTLVNYRDAWSQAARAWFIDARHLEGDARDGVITLLTPDLQTPLGEIVLGNVGFKRFSPLPAADGSDALYRFTVDLYVERMSLRLVQFEG